MSIDKLYTSFKSNKFENVNGFVTEINVPGRSFVIRSFNGINNIGCVCINPNMNVESILNTDIQVYGKLNVDHEGKLFLEVISKADISEGNKYAAEMNRYNKIAYHLDNEKSCKKKISQIKAIDEPKIMYKMAFVVMGDYEAFKTMIQTISFGSCHMYHCDPADLHLVLESITSKNYFHAIFIIGRLRNDYDVIRISSNENVRALMNRKYMSLVVTLMIQEGTKLKPLINHAVNISFHRAKDMFSFIDEKQQVHRGRISMALKKATEALERRLYRNEESLVSMAKAMDTKKMSTALVPVQSLPMYPNLSNSSTHVKSSVKKRKLGRDSLQKTSHTDEERVRILVQLALGKVVTHVHYLYALANTVHGIYVEALTSAQGHDESSLLEKKIE